MSPDGEQAIVRAGKAFGLVALSTGVAHPLQGSSSDMQFKWSPDGRWIAGTRRGQISLYDADDAMRVRSLGSAGDGPIQWSPDSKYLLVRRSPRSCALYVYGESLEIVQVQSGVRSEVRAAHCMITAGTIGWLDADLKP